VTKDDIVAISSGTITAAAHTLGSDLVETALKGLIGGVLGYIGKVIVALAIKKVKEYRANKWPNTNK